MRRTRVIVGLLLAVVLVLGMSAPAWGATELPELKDIEDHDYEASILALAARGFVGGYPDGTFKPDNPLQRQQFAKMAVLTLDYEVTAEDRSLFPDTPAPYDPVNNPLYPGSYVAVAADRGLMVGYTNGLFGFYDHVTRQQVISVVVRAAGEALAAPPAGYQGELEEYYSNQYHGANIAKAEYNGLLAGIPDLDQWDPTLAATRGEAAELLAQMYYRVGKILTLEAQDGSASKELTMAELKAMEATEGYGGFKNKLGNITPPSLYKGVAVKDLMELVGGGETVTVVATDGYELQFTADEVNGLVTVYDKDTGAEITDYSGTLTMILAYSREGAALRSDEGALRIAFVSDEPDQITESKKWVDQILKIVVGASAEAE